MIDLNKHKEWIERLIDGDPVPPEIEAFIESDPECREYKAGLERVAFALETFDIPEPPLELTDGVMAFIEAREREETAPKPDPIIAYLAALWRDIVKTLSIEIYIPQILRREAFPTAFATLTVVLGIFLTPQVEAGKNFNVLETPIAAKALSISDKFIEERDRLTEKVAGWIKGATGSDRSAKPIDSGGSGV